MTNTGPYRDGYTLVYEDGESTLETHIPNTIISPKDKIHIVKDGESIHSIAHQYYKDSGKWYIIASANHIFNPFREIVPGTKLIIPNHGI